MAARVDWAFLGLLRFVLACVVVGVHLPHFDKTPTTFSSVSNLLGGKAAVIGFLLVSGYSIAASLRSQPSGFYRRRWLRIYPMYFGTVILTLLVQLTTGGEAQLINAKIQGSNFLTALGNFALLQTFVVKPLPYNGPLWSLAIECFYYALAPLLLAAPRLLVWLAIAVSMTCYLLPPRDDLGMAYFLFSKFNALRYFWAWGLGFLAWHRRSRWLMVLAVAAAVPVALREPDRLALVTYGLSMLLLLLPLRLGGLGWLRKLMDYLGDLSFPLYLLHFPVFIAAYVLFDLGDSSALFVLAIVICAAVMPLESWVKKRWLVPLLFPAKRKLQGTGASSA